MQIQITDLSQIQSAAEQFIAHLGRHRVVAFYGQMGAGKTTFIKAVCQSLGVADVITSPTFAIVNEYSIDHSPLTIDHSAMQKPESANGQWSMVNGQSIYHFDFYRIKQLSEVYDMGYEDYFYSGSLCLIEWPELVEPLLPDDALRVTIAQQPDGQRTISF